MEIIGDGKEKSTVYVAVPALVLMGLALIFSTWSILQRQRQASLEHLELTSVAVLQAVDSSLRRGPMMRTDRFSVDTRDFFRDLEASGDILFVGIIDDRGVRILAAPEERAPTVVFPENALETLRRDKRWQGQAVYGDKKIYVAARQILPTMASHHRRGGRHSGGGAFAFERNDSGHFLMVAVDMDRHFAVYRSFRRTAIFQTAYILAAAVFLLAFAARFISRRKMASRAMYLERFQARLIDSFPDGLLIVDGNGIITAANPAARAMLAPNGEQVTGGNLADVSLPPLFAAQKQETERGVAEEAWRQVSLGGMHLEIRALPLRGGPASTQNEDDSPSLMVILHDRTQIRTLEKNLAEAEKLAAVGSLAAGVAHEIRNPLSALRGFAQYFAKKLAGRQPEEEYAATMVREADRLNRVITDLLFLTRPRDLSPVPTNLETVCNEIASLMRFELQEHGVTLTCDIDEQTVQADRDALKQTLLNLVLNALEAMAGDASKKSGEDNAITIASRRGSRHGRDGVWVTVADTGPGLPEEARKNAFKPFFTTKKKGTGLGLALVDAIMRGHGGEAAVDGKNLTGCRVSLFFPDAQSGSVESKNYETYSDN